MPPMLGAPKSYESLWDTAGDMMPYNVVMLSCECDETYNSNPPVLEQYLNAGGARLRFSLPICLVRR